MHVALATSVYKDPKLHAHCSAGQTGIAVPMQRQAGVATAAADNHGLRWATVLLQTSHRAAWVIRGLTESRRIDVGECTFKYIR